MNANDTKMGRAVNDFLGRDRESVAEIARVGVVRMGHASLVATARDHGLNWIDLGVAVVHACIEMARREGAAQ